MSGHYVGYAFESKTATINGKTKTWAEWCKERGVKRATVYHRIWYEKLMGRDADFATVIEKLYRQPNWWRDARVTIDGKTRTPEEWCEANKLTKMCVYQRLQRGWDEGKAFSMPTQMRTRKQDMPVTLNGVTHTFGEWCKLRDISVKHALVMLSHTGNVEYSLLDHNGKMEYRREHGLVKHIDGKRDRRRDYGLSVHPTPEVIEMCSRCPYEDCLYGVTKCLHEKREREKREGTKL